jgi:GNAT superfamily N-acetyltransferase
MVSPARGSGVVTLREITNANRDAILTLRLTPEQQPFVGTVASALSDAHAIPEARPWYRAVYADDQPVGFVMLSWNVTPEPPRIIGPWFLWKLLIDERYQRRGFGRKTVMLVADIVRANGAAELLTSFVPGDGGPEPFYLGLGFRPTGELDENGEIIVALDLRTSSLEQRVADASGVEHAKGSFLQQCGTATESV